MRLRSCREHSSFRPSAADVTASTASQMLELYLPNWLRVLRIGQSREDSYVDRLLKRTISQLYLIVGGGPPRPDFAVD